MTPYYSDEAVTLYHGDCRDVLGTMPLTADCIVTDPPYGETSLEWDRWPGGWPTAVSGAAKSMWCFGSMRMFLDRRDEFVFWHLSQDVVWRKNAGTGFSTDRFRRVHESAVHWYRGDWSHVHHEPSREAHGGPRKTRYNTAKPPHAGAIVAKPYEDDGTRLPLSVLECRNLQGRAIHPTEKPVGILDPLIRYACPPGGTVLDPFAGSGSTAEAARMSGRKAILIEADERYCELIARRMSQGILI